MSTIINKIRARIRNHLHVRFKEPVLVFESDDWGLWRSPEEKSILKSFGQPKIWGFDQLESTNELERIFSVLESFKDSEGKSPFIEANFIVTNPDFQKTTLNNYKELFLKPINEDLERKQKWCEGVTRKVFLPQYHGRLHFNYANMLRSLQQDPLSKKIFEAGIHGGINNYQEGEWSLHSEYQDWHTGSVPVNLYEWISKGLNEFESTFGYRAKSTIAPQYIFSPATAGIFHQENLTTIQGTNMQMFKSANGKENKKNLPIGSCYYDGLVSIGRNVKFEPSRGVESWKVNQALKSVRNLINQNIPAIVDSHRINYTGNFAAEGSAQLESFIEGVCKMGVRFLSSFELAEAILNNGHYTEFFSGKQNRLTFLNNNFPTKLIRDNFF